MYVTKSVVGKIRLHDTSMPCLRALRRPVEGFVFLLLISGT